MRIRTIKPEFFTHEGLFDAEKQESLPLRVAFAGLWCAADRSGRFKWEPRRLGISILPYDEVDFSRVLHALTTRGFIVKYRVGEQWFGAIPSWEKHQVINNRETSSSIPDVSVCEELDASCTRDPRVTHASKEEGKGREGERKEHTANAPEEEYDGADTLRRERNRPLPESLNREDFRDAWMRWRAQFLAIAKRDMSDGTALQQLQECAQMGAELAIKAINHTISVGRLTKLCLPRSDVATNGSTPIVSEEPSNTRR